MCCLVRVVIDAYEGKWNGDLAGENRRALNKKTLQTNKQRNTLLIYNQKDVSDEHIASIFRAEKYAEQKTSVKAGGNPRWCLARRIFGPKDGGDMFN
jgi:hypothetical protein